jgi:uncharacterized OB-fold protein
VSAAFPRPDPQNADDARFWTALRDGELRIQRCSACATFRHPPKPVCAHCGARESAFVPVAGTGEIWSFTVIHPPTLPAFADRTPYEAVVVRLDGGVFLVSNLIDCPASEIVIGARVELAITQVDDGLFLPLFRPSRPT